MNVLFDRLIELGLLVLVSSLLTGLISRIVKAALKNGAGMNHVSLSIFTAIITAVIAIALSGIYLPELISVLLWFLLDVFIFERDKGEWSNADIISIKDKE